ncbi:hypothetical protein SD074_18140 [Prolixibacter sp. SD074]|nr:hypothetical protein SD074_18140 [Prolixibacter sp. SD074]
MIMDVGRNYQFSDAQLIRIGSEIKNLLPLYMRQLTDHTPAINEDFLIQFQRTLKEAKSVPATDSLDEEITLLEEEIKEKMENACMVFRSLRLYIQAAFPHDGRVWEQLGFRDYQRASTSRNQMLMKLQELQHLVEKHRAALQVVHCPPDYYWQIRVLRAELQSMGQKLNEKLVEQKRLQSLKLARMNALYAKLLIISDVAKKVFANQPQVLEMFKLPKHLAAAV